MEHRDLVLPSGATCLLITLLWTGFVPHKPTTSLKEVKPRFQLDGLRIAGPHGSFSLKRASCDVLSSQASWQIYSGLWHWAGREDLLSRLLSSFGLQRNS
jgi:hypothetical protein